MSRPFGSKNRRYRVAERDRKRIVAVVQRTDVARAFVDGVAPDEGRRIAGLSDRHARRLLQESMKGVSEMPEDERERLKQLPPLPSEGSRMRRALDLRVEGRSYQEIADDLDIALSTAFDLVAKGAERLTGEEVRS